MNRAEKVFSCVTYAFDWVYRVLLEYAKVVLLVIIVIVSAQVFSRKVFGTSIRWSEEVALLLMVWTAFISMAIGVEKGLHIAIEMFFNRFPGKIRIAVTKINTFATFLFGLALVVYGGKLIGSTMSSTLPATQWPAGMLYLMMPVGGVFIMYFTFLSLFGLERFRHFDIEDGAADAPPEPLAAVSGKEADHV